MTMFDTVLVANRGEIAVRVIRTLRALGVRSVAVFSDADADARHVREADTAVRIGQPPAGESYLRVDRLLEAAARQQVRDVYLEVRVDNDAARTLYRTEGFAEVGVRRGYYGHGRVDGVTMHRALPGGERA